MKPLLYKVNTNFFKTPLNKGFQSDKSIEWELKCACVGGDSSVPLGFVSLSENLFMIAGALIMLFL